GESYRAGARAYCDPNISAHRSWWTPFIFWTQPGSIIKVEGGTAINNLDIYPNPSRDIFNVSFTSEDVQDLDVRVINVVGEVVYTENLEQFVGEYTKSLDLATYTKGVYFLEITTNNGVVNKKLILQ
ncbi:MAG: T9SS type A sorting domain-containing protein, partial [Flavobacteriales bacterium]|nr:T9SS type A sorting domain-containing protein [Flavobacteriales bacterium]